MKIEILKKHIEPKFSNNPQSNNHTNENLRNVCDTRLLFLILSKLGTVISMLQRYIYWNGILTNSLNNFFFFAAFKYSGEKKIISKITNSFVDKFNQ